MKKGDFAVLALLLVLCGVCFFAERPPQTENLVAEVWVDGAVVDRIPLTAGMTPVLKTYGGCRIALKEDGAVFFEADCPDKLCVRHGRLRSAGDVFACVPNRTVLRLTAQTAYDAVSY